MKIVKQHTINNTITSEFLNAGKGSETTSELRARVHLIYDIRC